ncbi:class I SAM-dependent methyltransferase [Paenibacillus chitinolyticus]|uniref:class I SAM-dependent methyltransferase n=1 Tax=Paenibacillus chitinolyticus TaxID=79263 RepID=UPI001C4868F5|nr:class I SAM-dependent methyltransferase [Paenibacillus chitinolyticus]MBV6713358.1 class I SAM-dependent methyltransferase [Paenibacillus chitinolyticus]
MNPSDYIKFYDRVGKINGWDFSNVKCVSEGIKWDFYNEVMKTCKRSDILLDIGTGGGEAILSIAESALLLVGIDQSTGMIDTATKNSAKSGVPNVRFLKMDAENLEFPADFFNVISCRHSEFFAKEIAKVLIQGGTFHTQQVSENDKSNIKEAFGRGQAFGTKAGTLKHQYITELSEAGFSDIQSFECNVIEYYQTAEDLIFLLKHTPIIPDFGRTEVDFQMLQQFIKENQTEKGIRTNSERFIITAKL